MQDAAQFTPEMMCTSEKSAVISCSTCEPHVVRRKEGLDMQITPGEEGFFGLGSPFVNGDPSGVPGNVQASGKCVLP